MRRITGSGTPMPLPARISPRAPGYPMPDAPAKINGRRLDGANSNVTPSAGSALRYPEGSTQPCCPQKDVISIGDRKCIF